MSVIRALLSRILRQGATLGSNTGSTLGPNAGATLGANTGATLGANTGATLGANTGATLGANTGATLGANSGATFGANMGAMAEAVAGAVAGAKAGTFSAAKAAAAPEAFNFWKSVRFFTKGGKGKKSSKASYKEMMEHGRHHGGVPFSNLPFKIKSPMHATILFLIFFGSASNAPHILFVFLMHKNYGLI